MTVVKSTKKCGTAGRRLGPSMGWVGLSFD